MKEYRGPETFADSEQRFRSLALAALEKQRAERGRLARLLHDEVAPVLSGAGLQLDILRMDLESKVPEISSRTADIQCLLERVVKHIRDLSYELNPDVVNRSGLEPALKLLASRFRRIFPGSLGVTYDESIRIPVEVEVALDRIAEEAVANAVQHADCTQIEIIVEPTRGGAVLRIQDNGIGFDYDRERRVPRGLGLLMMEHCARKAGLLLNFNEHAGGGSAVSAILAGRKGPRT